MKVRRALGVISSLVLFEMLKSDLSSVKDTRSICLHRNSNSPRLNSHTHTLRPPALLLGKAPDWWQQIFYQPSTQQHSSSSSSFLTQSRPLCSQRACQSGKMTHPWLIDRRFTCDMFFFWKTTLAWTHFVAPAASLDGSCNFFCLHKAAESNFYWATERPAEGGRGVTVTSCFMNELMHCVHCDWLTGENQ